MEFELPYPPSVNTYWRKVGNRMLISKKGRLYKQAVRHLTRGALARPLDGPVAISIQAAPPDRKTRDLDNLLKAPLDALVGAKILLDDSQVDEIHLYRVSQVAGGLLTVSISPLDGPQALDMGSLEAELAQRIERLEIELQAAREALAAIQEG